MTELFAHSYFSSRSYKLAFVKCKEFKYDTVQTSKKKLCYCVWIFMYSTLGKMCSYRAATMLKSELKSSQECSCLSLEKKFNISKNFSATAIGK
jgi:hypothetical protein